MRNSDWCQLLQCRCKHIHGQVCGVGRFFGQSADRLYQLLAFDLPRLSQGLSRNYFCQQGTAGHGRYAPLCFESGLGDLAIFHLQPQFQNVATSRVFELHRDVSVGELSRIPRVLKVIQYLLRIH